MKIVSAAILDQIDNINCTEVSLNIDGLLYHKINEGFDIVIECGPSNIYESWGEDVDCDWYVQIGQESSRFVIYIGHNEYKYDVILGDDFPVIVTTELGYYPFEAVMDYASKLYSRAV